VLVEMGAERGPIRKVQMVIGAVFWMPSQDDGRRSEEKKNSCVRGCVWTFASCLKISVTQVNSDVEFVRVVSDY